VSTLTFSGGRWPRSGTHDRRTDTIDTRDLRRIFRHRYGALCRKAAVEKMQHQIEVIAPWIPDTEAEQLIDQIMQLPLYYRRPSGKELGERIRRAVTSWGLTMHS
jgi:hypothetical protein